MFIWFYFQNWQHLNYRAGQIYFYASDFSNLQFYLRGRSGTQKKSTLDQSARSIKKQRENFLFVLYYLNRTWKFHFQYMSIKSFCNEPFVVWMLFKCLNRMCLWIIQEKYTKSMEFTKIKIWHRCFDNNLQNIFSKNILDNGTRQILLVVILIVGLCLDN